MKNTQSFDCYHSTIGFAVCECVVAVVFYSFIDTSFAKRPDDLDWAFVPFVSFVPSW
jgi:hypothetical protein